MTKFRWAVLGTGAVAGKFVAGLRATKMPATVDVVASRRLSNAARLARPAGARATTYEEAIATPGIDGVYIATPPALHESMALRCLDAGIPCLIEKPIAADPASALQIVRASRRSATFAMEGMWTRFLPSLERTRRLLEEGAVGQVTGMSASFGIPQVVDPTDPRFVPDLGGGALMHRGLYGVSLALHLLGPVTAISGYAHIGETGVDEEMTATLRHHSGALTQVHASLISSSRNDLVIRGTEGSLVIDPPLYRPYALRLHSDHARPRAGANTGRLATLREHGAVHIVRQHLDRVMPRPGVRMLAPYRGNGYVHEADAMMTAIAEGRTEHPLMPLDESVRIAELMDELRSHWAVHA